MYTLETMVKAVVTGATGFVGANLVRRLLHDGHEVHLFVRKHHKDWRITDIADEVHLHTVDFQDKNILQRTFEKIQPTWIFHTAVYGAYSSQRDLTSMISTNIQGTANLLEAAAHTGFDAFVNTGSSSEYGYKKTPPHEDELLEPNGHYAITKAAATHLAQYMAAQTSLQIPTLRLYSVYGPYEEPTRLFPTLLIHAQRGSLPPLVNAKTAHDYVYIEDVVDAYLLAAKTKMKERGAIFNIGSGKQTTMEELVTGTQNLFSLKERPIWGSMPQRSWDTTSWVADARKAKRVLGWSATTSVKKGLTLTASWLKKHAQEYAASYPKR